MRTPALFIALLLLTGWLHAQTRISGSVKDGKGHPLRGASITIKDSYDGATADSLGKFHFEAAETGAQTLTITNIGYNPVEQTVTLSGTPIELHIALKEQLSELKAVTITAGSFTAGDAKRGAVLSSIDVATTAGSNADITAALKTLPGAQQVGEQEGLFVRGGAGYEAKQYIDGTLVNNPYYTSVPDIAQRGRFSPFLFKGTVFSTGGYSALYGQALSSVVLLESIDLPEKSEIDATISPLVVGLGTQQLARNKQSSYGFSYDYVNAYAYFKAIPQDVDYFRMPQFHNGDANFRIRTKSGGMIKYYTTFAYNDLGLRRQDWDSLNMKDAFGLTNHNWYNNLSWRDYLSNGWKMDLGASYSTNLDNLGQRVQNAANQDQSFNDSVFWMNYKGFNIDQRQDLSQVRAVFDKKLGTLSAIRFGSEYWYSYNYQKYRNPAYHTDTLYKFTDNFNSLFAESDIYLTNALAAKVGVRYEHSSVINKSDIAPRVSLAYRTGPEAQVSLAYGIFYQKPESNQLFATTNVGFTKATHYIINYQKMSKDRIFRIEAYYKKYEDLIKTVPINYYYSTYNNSGSGYAKGFELFWRDKKSIKNFDYWISYSYLDTKRNYLNFTEQMTPNFAATHTASLVMKRFFTKIKSGVNVTYSYATGRPYYNLMLNGLKYNLAEQGKTVDYNSLNLSAEYIPSMGNNKAKSFVVLFASVSNVLGYNSVYGYNFSYSGLYKQPITPPAKRFYFVGCFISWGVDRSQDAINNNL
ncbi:TonB-dependent receptor [Puia dinghuensis]|uniref:TonB-dependent receptor n=1 Tax=Puia dinghuensis TaxID=1792502 RepID=A0A8J2UEN1_9BACT|nr:TonB-dependent receptor [Puia dinghuensis]GGB07135.1 TonB-dependent receptor [Puia dinghuensis]